MQRVAQVLSTNEKDKVVIADCYSYNEGKIKYVEDKEGRIEVYIG